MDADLLESLLDALQSGELRPHAESSQSHADAPSVLVQAPLTPQASQSIPYRQRRRQALLVQPTCTNCGGESFVTVLEGMVCTDCAVYVMGSNIGIDEKNLSYDRLKNGYRHRRHVYKRRVHFCDFIKQLQGNTNIHLDDDEYAVFMWTFPANTAVTPDSVLATLKCLGWTHRFRKHRYTLARQLGDWKPVVLEGAHFFELLRIFSEVERIWDRNPNIRGSRKTFFSYPFIFSKLCKIISTPQYTRDVDLLKGKSQLDNQHALWRRMCRRMRASRQKNCKYYWY